MKEIVIKIPDLVYESIIVGAETSRDEADVLFAIRQGTVLPKGHGDLIDRSKLEKDTDWSDRHDEYMAYSQEQVGWADAVIPADKESDHEG